MKKAKIKKRKDNTGQEFWIDYEDIPHDKVPADVDTFHKLSIFLLKESMRAQELTFRRKNKIAYVNLWCDWLNEVQEGKEPLTPYTSIPAIASILIDSFNVMHKAKNRPAKNRDKKWLKFKIRRQLESLFKTNSNDSNEIG
jgi:hypothetical protein